MAGYLQFCLFTVAITIIGCTGRLPLLLSAAPIHYTLKGKIAKEFGGLLDCKLECLSDSGLLDQQYLGLNNGDYSLALTAKQAEKLRRFRILESSGDESFFDFDPKLLRDSVIILDFRLQTLSKNYRVLIGTSSHSHATTFDTIWIDLNGHRVSKAVSDSLWKDIPHK